MRKYLFILLLPVLTFFQEVVAQPELPETITTNQTYDEDKIVPSDQTTTISAGVTITFSGNHSITVQDGATLIADGTPTSIITFTSQGQQQGDWGSIVFDGDGDGDDDAIGYFDNCVLKYGGDDNNGEPNAEGPIVGYEYARITVENCVIKDSYGSGIGVSGEGIGGVGADFTVILTAENNQIYNCQNGITLYFPDSTATIKNNTILDIEHIGATGGHGIVMDLIFEGDTSSVVIENNIISGIEFQGINAWSINGDIVNNAITHVGDNGLLIADIGLAGDLKIRNNIFYDYGDGNDQHGVDSGNEAITVSYNYVWDSDHNSTVSLNVTSDSMQTGEAPAFITDDTTPDDPSDLDYRLKFNSICIQLGDTARADTNLDGSRNDIGVFGGSGADSPFYHAIAGEILTETLDPDYAPFRLIGTAEVVEDCTFTIAPDDYLLIKAEPGAELEVDGRLILTGVDNEADSFLVFDELNSGGWEGISLMSGSSGYLENVLIKNADCGILISSADTVTIDSANIEYSKYNGILILGSPDTVGVSYTNISYCGSNGMEIANVTGDCFINTCMFEYNDVGAYLEISDAKFERCTFYNNKKNGMRAFTSASPELGRFTAVGDTIHGNLFQDNGAAANTSLEGAELYIFNALPILTSCGNDFDHDTNSDTTNTRLIVDIGTGTGYNLDRNFFRGYSTGPRGEWLYPLADFDTLTWITDTDDRYRDAQSLDAFEIAEILRSNGNYEDAADIYLELVEEEEYAPALSGWIKCQNMLGADAEDIIDELENWVDNESMGFIAFWRIISYQNSLEDFELSIDQLDDFIDDSETPEDSLQGVLGQLTTYYQMALADMRLTVTRKLHLELDFTVHSTFHN
ncbi:MAG: right-handed parallel beta-helix repeat-containing protein [Candidatus Electryonea clarkiae]|nr:right-handed parallel beta-helix repeat-containing protein [Candidatus Electryonea clarkiae]MDP8285284.1 right-handed parallel beta-helix repeat-containing protein [Candidatus Electryonea clarkiae]